MTVIGLDIFAGNGAVDLRKAYTEDGVRFVIPKASEGADFADPHFAANYQAALDAGMIPGAYHFARPDDGNTAAAEAANFLRVLGPRRGLLALDFERRPVDAAWADEFLHTVAAATGLDPFCYTFHAWAGPPAFVGAGYPLWIPLDAPGADPIVQSAHLIGTLGTLDVDTYAGTLEQLRAAAGLAPAPAPVIPIRRKASRMLTVRDNDTGAEYLQSDDGALHWIPDADTVTAYTKTLGQAAPVPISHAFAATLPGVKD